ncbi:hypothetical protein E2C01_101068 [Portunus trituberculatus]|uniref:Uncharacterized protein n=1 Tax=Portunus trituberculatus TaxID=210409 RepID=A0A5B7KJJ5_PORTR|nr:hypothetical protein [Portunus trituberculatus]
MKEEEKDLG